jgi:hypothetical protein
MQFVGKAILACAFATAAFATACAGKETGTDGDAPDLALDALEQADMGDTYNGWTQTLTYACDMCRAEDDVMQHTFTRSYGDSTRGGGACAVAWTPNSCSDDSSCVTLAQGYYGSSAYGYCVSNRCYIRTGSQAAYCTMGPNRGAGTLQMNFGSMAYDAIGCMTKTAGPNTACGGTNPSLYMRTHAPTSYYYSSNCPP